MNQNEPLSTANRPKEYYAQDSGDFGQYVVVDDKERLTQMIAQDWDVSQIEDKTDTELIRVNVIYVTNNSPELHTVHGVCFGKYSGREWDYRHPYM